MVFTKQRLLALAALLALTAALCTAAHTSSPRAPSMSAAKRLREAAYGRDVHTSSSSSSSSSSRAGVEFNLSDFLDQPALAKQLSAVTFAGVDGNSGFIRVNASLDSNIFFWYFPARSHRADAPLVLWLQGGPGSSDMFGLFAEVGPLTLDSDGDPMPAPVTWNEEFAMLFVDNPVGTGFSYTGSDAGYVNNMDEMATDLYSALAQFFTVWTEHQKTPFFITGESYGGKYIPSIAARILRENERSNVTVRIPLAGVAIGDGLVDPISQTQVYADVLYNMALIDGRERLVMLEMQGRLADLIETEQWDAASDVLAELVNGGAVPCYYTNVTGLWDYDDVRNTVSPAYPSYHGFVTRKDVSAALHVGAHKFQSGEEAGDHLNADICKSVKGELTYLLDSDLRVMLYNGQWDLILHPLTSEALLDVLDWDGLNAFRASPRIIWRTPGAGVDVSGYARSHGPLTQVVVRNAGHILPYNQPVAAKDMITRFVHGQPFSG